MADHNVHLDTNDINSYSDEKIAIFLNNLREQSLEDLMALQEKIATEYADATEAYEAERTSIRWARRRYWLFIFVGVFREIWRVLVQGKDTKISILKHQKAELKKSYQEKDEAIHTQLSLVQDSIDTIKMYADEISQRTEELTDLKAVIEQLDARYHQDEDGDPQDLEEIAQQLNHHIEDRDIITQNVQSLYQKIEGLVNALSGLFDDYIPDYLPTDFLVKHREANREKIAALKERCHDIKHPIIPKLLAFLSHQTAASLKSLQAEIAKDKSLFRDRVLGDIVWEANSLFPAIFVNKNREQALFDYMAMKEKDLEDLQAVIEATDVTLHQRQDNKVIQQQLDELVSSRERIITEISNLLLIHRDILSGNHAQLMDKVHRLARQQGEHAKTNELKRICNQNPHPVTKALHQFLMYRTDVGLKALKAAMHEDPSYLESRALVRAIEEAGVLEPRITEGWVKEMELPSIKEIQQHYFQSVANKLEVLNETLTRLTDKKVDMEEEIHRLQLSLRPLKNRFTQITGMNFGGYLSRAELNKLTQQGLRPQFDALIKEFTVVNKQIKEIKDELKELDKEVHDIEEAQANLVVEPILFTQEVLQDLIRKCDQATQYGRTHPIAKALKNFLDYPTPSLLTKLKLAMQEHSGYQKNSKIMQLLQEANRYFPYIQHESPAMTERLFEMFRSELAASKQAHDDHVDKPKIK